MAVNTAENAKETTVGACTTVDGTYVLLAGVVGEIALPESETPVQKFQANDDTNAALIIGDEELGDVELAVKYANNAAYDVVEALRNVAQYFEFTLAGGDTFIYYGVINKVGPVTGAENGACVGSIGIVFSHLVSATAAS
jgi:hypothetical protein